MFDQKKFSRWKIVVLIFFLIIFLFLFFKLESLFYGFLLAILVDHFVEILEKTGINRYLSLGIIILVLSLTIILFFFNLLPVFIKNILNIIKNIMIKIDDPSQQEFTINLFFKKIYYKDFIKSIFNFAKQKLSGLSNTDGHSLTTLFLILQKSTTIAQKFTSAVNSSLGFFCSIFVVRGIFKYLFNVNNKIVASLSYNIREEIKQFLFNQFIIALFNSLFFALILNFFGVDGWFSVALAAFLGSFITSFGSLIGIIMTIITIVVQQYHWHSIIMIIFFLLIPYIIENYVLIPYLICDPLKIHYVFVLISVLGILKLCGWKYVIFSIPIVIFFKKIIITILSQNNTLTDESKFNE